MEAYIPNSKTKSGKQESWKCQPVFCNRLSQDFGHRNRPPHEGDRIEEDDACDVEEQVAQSDLESRSQVVAIRCKRGKNSGRRCT
jgi:hypothetical protein